MSGRSGIPCCAAADRRYTPRRAGSRVPREGSAGPARRARGGEPVDPSRRSIRCPKRRSARGSLTGGEGRCPMTVLRHPYRDPARCRFPVPDRSLGTGPAHCVCGRPIDWIQSTRRDPESGVPFVVRYWRHRAALLPDPEVMSPVDNRRVAAPAPDITRALQARTSDKVSSVPPSGGRAVDNGRRTVGAGGRIAIPTESEMRAWWGDR